MKQKSIESRKPSKKWLAESHFSGALGTSSKAQNLPRTYI
jgi:hypothetical protein